MGTMTSPVGAGKRLEGRRYSGERTNVYTECGRHSDDWLFGPMKGAVKKMWEQRSPGVGGLGDDDKGGRGM
jgi:hypothetical protein